LLFVDEDGAQPKLAALTAKGNKNQNENNRLAAQKRQYDAEEEVLHQPVSVEFENMTKLAGTRPINAS
jgi:hypothetical protein